MQQSLKLKNIQSYNISRLFLWKKFMSQVNALFVVVILVSGGEQYFSWLNYAHWDDVIKRTESHSITQLCNFFGGV